MKNGGCKSSHEGTLPQPQIGSPTAVDGELMDGCIPRSLEDVFISSYFFGLVKMFEHESQEDSR